MCAPQTEVRFRFTDPTEALARLLTCSPLAADPNNLAFFPEKSDELEDYCHGARMARIDAALPKGTAALTAILFFDELNQDQKGFSTSEGAIIVGGFFRKDARESTYAKSSLGAFPGIDFPRGSKTLACVKRFSKDLRQFQIAAMKKCFKNFNAKGGAVIPLQSGKYVYFPRAVVLAIYGDQPAAVKCSLTGSACPQCYAAKPDFADPPQDGVFEMRTVQNMKSTKRALEEELRYNRTKAERELTRKRARTEGVSLRGLSAWCDTDDDNVLEDWIFGPDPILDNVYQNLPQVVLHGLDEGLTMKLCCGILQMAIAFSTEDLTKVCRRIDASVLQVATSHTQNSNVELGERSGFKLFRHGVSDYLLKKRRIDGGWYISILRHLHVALCTTTRLCVCNKCTHECFCNVRHECCPGMFVHNVPQNVNEMYI